MHNKEKKIKHFDLRVILPNMITLFALCSGVTSIKLALDGRFDYAIITILLAAILDGLDGYVARALKGTSSFGAQLDSLADLVNFGVAPALIIYISTLHALNRIGWFCVLFYIIAMALRLARFNVTQNFTPHIENPSKDTSYSDESLKSFVGVPSPAAAILLMLPLNIYYSFNLTIAPIYVAFYCILISILMISRLRTLSFKKINFKLKNIGFVFIMIALLMTSLVSFPNQFLIFLSALYLIHIIYLFIRFTIKWYIISRSRQKERPQNNNQ